MIFHLYLGLPSAPFSRFAVISFSTMRATCLVSVTLLDFITLLIQCNEYKLRSSELGEFFPLDPVSTLHAL
jgi:hypothetical protein